MAQISKFPLLMNIWQYSTELFHIFIVVYSLREVSNSAISMCYALHNHSQLKVYMQA